MLDLYLFMSCTTYMPNKLYFLVEILQICYLLVKRKNSTDRELNVKGREIMCSRKSNHIIMDRFKVLYLMQRLEK